MARLGGDEFGLLLPETDEAGARALVRSLSERVTASATSIDIPVSFSAGAVTVGEPPDDPDEMIRMADERMYVAKRTPSQHVSSAV